MVIKTLTVCWHDELMLINSNLTVSWHDEFVLIQTSL